MAFNYEYPYVDAGLHNDDWIVNQIKSLISQWVDVQKDWSDTKQAYEDLYKYVHDYFDNLDVSKEVGDYMSQIDASGRLAEIINQEIFSELNSKILNLTEQINELDKDKYLTRYNNHTALFVGDSWTYGTGASDHGEGDTKRFSSLLSTYLNMHEKNVGVGSTGFCDPGSGGENSPFITQITNAKNRMTTAEIDDVRLIVIGGGLNDHREGTTYSGNVFLAAVRNVCTYALENFPNAEIYCWYNSSGQEFDMHAFNFGCLVERGARLAHVHSVMGSWTWGFGTDWWSDSLHPNDTGHANIAWHLLQAIMGGLTQFDNRLIIPDIRGGSTAANTYGAFENGRFTFGPCNPSGSLSQGSNNIGTIPIGMAPMHNVYTGIYKGDTRVGTFAITAGGNVYAIMTEAVSDGYFIEPITYIPYGGAR